MNKIVSETEYFVAWLVLYLGGAIGGLILGGIAGGMVGVVLGSAGVELSIIEWIAGIVGFVIGVALSYVLFRWLVASMIVKKAEARVRTQMQRSSDGIAEDMR